ncbi:hypothetical protein ASPVEDRAFT_37464 [Aspergillus versicolor CBS 583.65]|uniref:Uncharacterized protein n=1 Tax=Aspergillus versicolor CBS 583.65 TaxID=1036611 RepID=A0A1L9P971_ASPVE|nr:uncharacterized protein ASPVEDRAFT_37464 [Aspergillus versicolor CBS 583.65]OJI98023.1 hypothetical protein ASPVEDRAFT_37464 [Aspergillus versicolor CBS 583.65]
MGYTAKFPSRTLSCAACYAHEGCAVPHTSRSIAHGVGRLDVRMFSCRGARRHIALIIIRPQTIVSRETAPGELAIVAYRSVEAEREASGAPKKPVVKHIYRNRC